METWLNCENLLIAIGQKQTSYSQQTLQVINECADICLTALQALKVNYKNISEVALLCVGICEECADICERYNDNLFKTCAAICRNCSNAFAPLALDAK
jgi:hypothetical protein